MKTQIKIIVSWLIIPIALLIHGTIEIVETLYFSPLPKQPLHKGIPAYANLIYIFSMISPLIIGFISLFIKNKGFKWGSLVYAILLGVFNTYRFIETIRENPFDYAQIILLLFIIIVNVWLIILLNQWKKLTT